MNRNVYFLVLPNILVLDMVGPAETFKLASEAFRLTYIAPEENITMPLGLKVTDLKPFPKSLPKNSLLVIPGVYDSSIDFRNDLANIARNWIASLKESVERGDISILCICSGAVLAAEAGLLNDRRCTTHHSIIGRLKQIAPKAKVIDNLLFVEDCGVYTCAGIMSGIDLALELVRKFIGVEDCIRVAREMVVYLPRSGSDSQNSPWLKYRYHHHPIIHRAQDLIVSNPREYWTLEKVSSEVHVSSRHLSRIFKQYLNISVKDYHEHIKLILVSQYMEQGKNLELATSLSGFSSSRQYRRAKLRSKVVK
ncbi:MAG: HTH-type transcriptional regulator CdhR [Candidatus Celerinatantimonas neptuna]|nr:MAG: HTH-type transcriptional regulator CdhR [Candidatus Celerinatantimonas neptuna]